MLTECHLTYLEYWIIYKNVGILNYSTVQRPSCAANQFAASQEIPRISCNPEVHYRTHKRPPPVCTLGQSSPVHIFTSHLLQIHPNIIHPSTPRSPQRSLSLRFPQQDPTNPPHLTQTRHMPSPSHLDFITRTILGEEQRPFSSSIPPLPRPSQVQIFSSTPGIIPYLMYGIVSNIQKIYECV